MIRSTVGCGPETVRALQERAARALPAEYFEYVGDWWLRHTNNSSWWMGTVLPHGISERDESLRRIGVAERFYAGLGKVTRFQVSPGACPDDLDAMLAERGYRRDGSMSLRTASAAEVRARRRPDGLIVRLAATATPAWFDVWSAVHSDGRDPRIEQAMLSRVGTPSAYVCILDGTEVVAVGRGVADSGWVGVFGMSVRPEARGRGAGRRLLVALAEWARGQGVDGLYLQVEDANHPAVRLYERVGFTQVCAYHYRTEPAGAGRTAPSGVGGDGSAVGVDVGEASRDWDAARNR